MKLKKDWWKYSGMLILTYSFWQGLVGEVPRREILNESIRNVFFHVPLWFAMDAMLFISVIAAIQYLRKSDIDQDRKSVALVETAVLFGFLGCITGATWAKFTWGQAWPNDPKLNSVAIGMLIYAAYLVLRSSIEDPQKKASLSAVYSIFAFVIFNVLIFILPRMTDSLHPGNGGNPAFGKYDMDNQMRVIFYPAIIGFMILGFWMSQLNYRFRRLLDKHLDDN